jgi:hypothetical protein
MHKRKYAAKIVALCAECVAFVLDYGQLRGEALVSIEDFPLSLLVFAMRLSFCVPFRLQRIHMLPKLDHLVGMRLRDLFPVIALHLGSADTKPQNLDVLHRGPNHFLCFIEIS